MWYSNNCTAMKSPPSVKEFEPRGRRSSHGFGRRRFLKGAASLAALSGLRLAAKGSVATPGGRIGLGINNYAFKRLPIEEGIRAAARIGYDSFELCVLRGHPADPDGLGASARRDIRACLTDNGMPVPQIFERIPILGDDAAHRSHLERIRRDAQFARDVSPAMGGTRADLGSHLGGNPKHWEPSRDLIIERLRDWAEVGRSMETVIAIKGHNLTVMDTSEKTEWVVRQVDSPWLRVVFDYSHFQFAGETLDAALGRLFPYTVMVSLQDGRHDPDKRAMHPLLPGDGTADYATSHRAFA